MRVKQPFQLLVSNSLIKDLTCYLLENNNTFSKIKLYFIINHLTDQEIKFKDDEFVQLNTQLLLRVIGSHSASYIKTLKKGGFIICDNEYKKGLKKFHYKLNPIYTAEPTTINIDPNSNLHKKLSKYINNKRSHNNRWASHLKEMNLEFMKLKFDDVAAKKWCNLESDPKKKYIYHKTVLNLCNKQTRYFKRNKTNNRLDTNLTSIKKELRQFIVGDYLSIDLKNSQPFFLNLLIKSIIYDIDILCYKFSYNKLVETFGNKGLRSILLIHQKAEKAEMADLKQFDNAVISGTLYDDFIETYGGEITRKEVKQIIFKVLFSRNYIIKDFVKYVPYKKDKEIFASVYPTVYEIIKILKSKNNKVLPIYLQKIESYIFIDCLSKELVEHKIIPFTIHDSVIIKSELDEVTTSIINEVFMTQIGSTPELDFESLNPLNKDKIQNNRTK